MVLAVISDMASHVETGSASEGNRAGVSGKGGDLENQCTIHATIRQSEILQLVKLAELML